MRDMVQCKLVKNLGYRHVETTTWLEDRNLEPGMRISLKDVDGIWTIESVGVRMSSEAFLAHVEARRAFSAHLQAQTR